MEIRFGRCLLLSSSFFFCFLFKTVFLPFQWALRLSLRALVCLCFGFGKMISPFYVSLLRNFFNETSLGSISFLLQLQSPALRSAPHCRHIPLQKSLQSAFMGRLSMTCSFMMSKRSSSSFA